MSWLFSQALVAAYSPAASSAFDRSAPLSWMLTAHPFSRNGKTREPWTRSQSGRTCAHLTAAGGEELLRLFLQASRARGSAAPDLVAASTAQAPVSGGMPTESFARFDPGTSGWKIPPDLLTTDSMPFSGRWPRSGSMRNGVAYQQPPLAPLTGATGSGFLPTPTAGDAKQSGSRNTPASSAHPGLTLTDWIRGDGGTGRLMPTPCHTDWKIASKPGQRRRQLTDPAKGVVPAGGRVSACLHEWMMGWPIGWTALEPLETAKFRQWLLLHSGS